MDAPHNDPLKAARQAAQEHRDPSQASPLEVALYALLLRLSRRTLKRLVALDARTPAKPTE